MFARKAEFRIAHPNTRHREVTVGYFVTSTTVASIASQVGTAKGPIDCRPVITCLIDSVCAPCASLSCIEQKFLKLAAIETRRQFPVGVVQPESKSVRRGSLRALPNKLAGGGALHSPSLLCPALEAVLNVFKLAVPLPGKPARGRSGELPGLVS